MVSDAELRHWPAQEQLFAFADSYLNASTVFCQQMASDTEACTWPGGAVVLMLAAHSVELFLKGAILKRSPSMNVWSRQHDLQALAIDYYACFPEPAFSWDIPFQSAVPEGLSEAELQSLKTQAPPPSILYRYPVQKGGANWQTLSAFEPHSFLTLLRELRNDYQRLRSQWA